MSRHTLSVKSLRTTMADRRAARLRRQSLERQLAGYTTDSDRLELDAILARHSAEETREIRSIINRQAMDRLIRSA